ncbi:MAG: hypothetical protein H6917_06030 [Novosphingobium sp.]|nr:hypothetical protein [Novosphingobium sp.]MCP5401928.1 hypothetical protein [Novosphingobium sp.]
MSRIFLVAAALLFGITTLAGPAAAQDTGERVNQLIVYGDDPCPPSTGDQITVCARKDESERYRIPEVLRGTDSPENDAWNNRVLAYETVGKYGSLSCSPAGSGGWTGCLNQMIETAYAEKESDPSLRFSELIAEERAKRLSTIDEEAAATQARVEEAERAYEERQKAEAQSKAGE